MPTYQYECENCDHAFEFLQSMTDKKLKKCPECGKLKLARLIGSGAGIIFKGTGFYETDFKTKPNQSASQPNSASKSESKSESTKKVDAPVKKESTAA